MDNLVYCFKFYFNDGTNEICGGKASKPEYLYNDFDGLMSWEEFDKLSENKPDIKETLKLAMTLYKKILKDFYRVEIINIKTNEVIDYIEE